MSCLDKLFDSCGDEWRESLVKQVLRDTEGSPRYEVVKEIGRGGTGVVYEVVDLNNNRRSRAVKIVAPKSAENVIARFREESRVLASVADIPGCCDIHEVGECHLAPYLGMPFIVIDLIRGVTGPPGEDGKTHYLSLADYLGNKATKLTSKQTAVVIRRCANALSKVHGLKNPRTDQLLAHRDLKPSNILLGESREPEHLPFEPYIIDFGLATPGLNFERLPKNGDTSVVAIPLCNDPSEDSLRLNSSELCSSDSSSPFEGTFAYAAPEQFNGEATQKVDTWALGTILYEMLVGKLPYPIPSEGKFDTKTLRARFSTPPNFRLIGNSDLRRICQGCLAIDPDSRPTSFELAQQLDNWLNYKPVAPSSPLRTFVLWMLRHPVATVLSTTAILMFAGAITAAAVFRGQRDQLTVEKLARGNSFRDRSEGTLGLPWFGAALRETSNSTQRNLLRTTIQTTVPLLPKITQMYSHEEPIRTFEYDSSGRYIIVSSGKHAIVWDVIYGALEPTPMLRVKHDREVYNASVNHLGDRLLTMAEDGILRLHSFPGGRKLKSLSVEGGDIQRSGFDKSGTRILGAVYFGKDYHYEVCVWDTSTGELLHRLPHAQNPISETRLSPNGKMLAANTLEGVWLWDLATKSHHVLQMPLNKPVTAIAFNKSESRLAVGGTGEVVEIWNVGVKYESGQIAPKLLDTKLKQSAPVESISFSDDDAVIVVQPTRGPVRIWDAKTYNELAGFDQYPFHLQFEAGTTNPLSQHVLTLDQSRKLLRVEAVSNTHTAAFAFQSRGVVFSAKLSPNNKFLAITSNEPSGDADKQINVIRIFKFDEVQRQFKDVLSIHYTNTFLSQVAFSNDNRSLYAGGTVLAKFDLTQEPIKEEILDRSSSYSQMHLDEPGGVVFGNSLGEITRYSLEEKTAKLISESDTSRFAISPSGKQILKLRTKSPKEPIWEALVQETNDSRKQQRLRVIPHPWFFPSGSAFSPTASTIVIPSEDGLVTVCDRNTGESVLKIETPDAFYAEFDSTGRALLSHGERFLQTWNPSNGQLVFSTSFSDTISRAKFSPDGTMIAVAVGTAVQVWDVKTQQPLTPYWIHEKPVADVLFSSDGTKLLSIGLDGIVRLWTIKNDLDLTDQDLVSLSELVGNMRIRNLKELPVPSQDAHAAWKTLVQKSPALFQTTSQENKQFAWEQIEYCEKVHAWKRVEELWNTLFSSPDYIATANDWQRLANSYIQLNQWHDAENAYRKASGLDPTNSSYCDWLGYCHLMQRNLTAALDFYLKAEQLGGNNVRLFDNIANLYVALGEYARAAEYFGKARLLEPSKLINWRREAAARLAAGQLADYGQLVSDLVASDHLKRTVLDDLSDCLQALLLDPNWDKTKREQAAGLVKKIGENFAVADRYWMLALLALRENNPPSVIEVLAQQSLASRRSDDCPREWMLLAICAHRKGSYSKRDSYVDQTINWLSNRSSKGNEAFLTVLEVEALRREFDLACDLSKPPSVVELRAQVAELNEMIEENERNEDLFVKRGSVFAQLALLDSESSNWNLAHHDFETAIGFDPKHADWWLNSFLCLTMSDAIDSEAVEFTERILDQFEYDTTNRQMLLKYLWVMALRGKPLLDEQKARLLSLEVPNGFPKIQESLSTENIPEDARRILVVQLCLAANLWSGDSKKVIAYLEQEKPSGPEYSYKNFALAILLAKSSELEKARQAYDRGEVYMSSEEGRNLALQLPWQQQIELAILRRLAEQNSVTTN